jgi:hypothetical protein
MRQFMQVDENGTPSLDFDRISNLAGFAFGLSVDEVAAVKEKGLPWWVLVGMGVAGGAIAFGAFAPESWHKALKNVAK